MSERQALLRQPEWNFKFKIDKKKLSEMIGDKNHDQLTELGNLDGILSSLYTSMNGLDKNVRDEDDRKAYFGENKIPEMAQKFLWELIVEAYQDKTLILLSAAALVSLSMGIYEDTQKKDGEPKVGWVEGAAIIVAVLVVILTNAINDYQKELQFRKLNAKKEDRKCKVFRQNQEMELSIFSLLVGDVFLLEPGEVVPVDGILFQSDQLIVDESSATGESDTIKKSTSKDPFIMSGSMVQEGVGRMIIVAVGVTSFHGRILMAMRNTGDDGEQHDDSTPLQIKLDLLAEQIAKLGMASAFLMLISLLLKFMISKAIEGKAPTFEEVVVRLVSVFIQAITIVVVAVPEGLPMAVTLALAYATTKMIEDNNLVRVLSACETMGNVTIVCSDKTGTLTQNRMTVVNSVIADTVYDITDSDDQPQSSSDNSVVGFKEKLQKKDAYKLLVDSIAINSTAFETQNDKGRLEFIGSKTECAILDWIKQMGEDYTKIRSESQIIKSYPFSSKNKCMATSVKSNSTAILYVKGASEIVLDAATHYLNQDGKESAITSDIRHQLGNTIQRFAYDALRTIGLAYRKQSQDFKEEQIPMSDLVIIGIVGIEDPLRPGVVESVKKFRSAGVYVKMITGDNIITAKAIAKKAGIFTKGGVAITGPEWRRLTEEEQVRLVPKMQVLARSSPEDKQIVVKILHKINETVAMTGDGTNDGPALKMADVGFSMGIAGTEVAKEASSIILMDDNFNSLISALKWGRTINAGVRKFLQFQLSVNITAVILAFGTSLVSDDGKSILSATQLLWVNLIMDTFAALALATEPPSEDVLNSKPSPREAPLITHCMWKHIIAQSLFQILLNILLILPFGAQLLHIFNPHGEIGKKQLQSCVFNVFVFCQIFNMINCRRIKDELNVFNNLVHHSIFLIIQGLIIVVQIILINFGGDAFNTVPISSYQWFVSVFIGFMSLPIGFFLRSIPVDLEQEQIKVPSVTLERMMWDESIKEVKTKLKIYNALRRKPRRSTTNSSISRSNSNFE